MGQVHPVHTIQGVGLDTVLAHVAAYDVPPLMEYAHKIRFERYIAIGAAAREVVVIENYDTVLAQGVNDNAQIGAGAGDILETNA